MSIFNNDNKSKRKRLTPSERLIRQIAKKPFIFIAGVELSIVALRKIVDRYEIKPKKKAIKKSL